MTYTKQKVKAKIHRTSDYDDKHTGIRDFHDEKAMLEKLSHSTNFKPNPDKNQKSFFDKMREMFS